VRFVTVATTLSSAASKEARDCEPDSRWTIFIRPSVLDDADKERRCCGRTQARLLELSRFLEEPVTHLPELLPLACALDRLRRLGRPRIDTQRATAEPRTVRQN
jgi:hypothetical protein